MASLFSSFHSAIASCPCSRSSWPALKANTAAPSLRIPPHASVTAFYTDCNTTSRLASRTSSTLYDVLQVPRTASEADIKTAYRRLARRFHPDVARVDSKEESTTRFLQIHSAYVALSDPERDFVVFSVAEGKKLGDRSVLVLTIPLATDTDDPAGSEKGVK